MEQDDASMTPLFVNIGSGQIEEELGGIQEDLENRTNGGEIHVSEEKVMNNPLILFNIFSYLELPVLLKLRRVCKVWDEAIISSSEFSTGIYLHVSLLFPCCTIAPLPRINPMLTKHVYITNKCWNTHERKGDSEGKQHDPKQKTDTAGYNLTTFFNQYHHYVENIKFEGQYCDSFHTYLVKALNVLDFLKLQGIVIKDMFNTGKFGYCWEWGNYKDDRSSTFVTYLARPNLRSLQLDNTEAGSPFHDIFQKLIDCAPNLKEITINGNFYPDLSTCKNLEILNYAGIPCYYSDATDLVEDGSFNLESLSKMLDQAKHSLIKLSLESSDVDCIPLIIDGHSEFKFPDVMKKLETLCIDENDGEPFFQQGFKKLNPVQLPKLKNLFIRVKSLDNVLEEISHSFVTISFLHLGGTISPNIRPRIPTLFPNLTSLTMPWTVGSLDEKPDFNAVIDFCSGWKLRKLDIGTALQSDWSEFMKGLGRLKQTQTDLRTLELPSQNNVSGEESKPIFEFWYDAKKQEVVTVNLNVGSLTFATHSKKTAMEGALLEFILKHPLEVHFI